MITIIAGGRTFSGSNEWDVLMDAINNLPWEITKVVSGGAKGADKMGERWAFYNEKQCDVYYPLWNKYGKGAGFVRNALMADNADALIAFWDGTSPGTCNMIEIAKKKGLRVVVYRYERHAKESGVDMGDVKGL